MSRQESAARRWLAAILGRVLDRLAPPPGCHAAATDPAATTPAAGGAPVPTAPTAAPGRDTWVISQPPPGSPLEHAPARLERDRGDGRIVIDEHGHVTVVPAASEQQTAPQPVADEPALVRPYVLRIPVSPLAPEDRARLEAIAAEMAGAA